MPHWEMFQSIIPAMHMIAMIAMHIYMSCTHEDIHMQRAGAQSPVMH